MAQPGPKARYRVSVSGGVADDGGGVREVPVCELETMAPSAAKAANNARHRAGYSGYRKVGRDSRGRYVYRMPLDGAMGYAFMQVVAL